MSPFYQRNICMRGVHSADGALHRNNIQFTHPKLSTLNRGLLVIVSTEERDCYTCVRACMHNWVHVCMDQLYIMSQN